MSNPLSVRRVKFQNIDQYGQEEDPPTYGIIASDSYASVFMNNCESPQELEELIEKSRSILDACDAEDIFPDADHAKIGWANFYGRDWTTEDG